MQKPIDKTKRRTSPPPFGAPYGNTSSYTPASDISAAPFVPAAENYSPPATEPSIPSFDGGGGSFDGGASSDY